MTTDEHNCTVSCVGITSDGKIGLSGELFALYLIWFKMYILNLRFQINQLKY